MVILVARCVLVTAVFLVVERICTSSRAGGIGVLVYTASPQFYFFNAQYAYQTLALAFAAGLVYFLLVSIDQPEPRAGQLFVVSIVCLAALVVTHHLTSWLTVAFLIVGAVGLYVLKRRAEARVVGLAAAVGLLVTIAWTALVGRRLFEYLNPIFSAALSTLISALGKLHGDRQRFTTPPAAPRPPGR